MYFNKIISYGNDNCFLENVFCQTLTYDAMNASPFFSFACLQNNFFSDHYNYNSCCRMKAKTRSLLRQNGKDWGKVRASITSGAETNNV